VRFLPGSPDLDFKVRFINTCDAMLHARRLGESFGLACAEFSIRNRPVLTYARSLHRHHINVLADKAFLYGGRKSLLKLLLELAPADITDLDWDCYSELYTPERVMRQFENTLIDPAVRRGVATDFDVRLSVGDRLAVCGHTIRNGFTKLSQMLPG
jgi:hypothetical protein